ncbi:MAG TPA: hypothetical protein VIS73_01715 [Rhodocyclaceae bacterium]
MHCSRLLQRAVDGLAVRRLRRLVGVLSGALLMVSLCLPLTLRAEAVPITEDKARAIALAAAGCDAKRDCVVKDSFTDGQWVFIVSFVHSRDDEGKPRFMPGGFVGITFDAEGKVIDRMPGL